MMGLLWRWAPAAAVGACDDGGRLQRRWAPATTAGACGGCPLTQRLSSVYIEDRARDGGRIVGQQKQGRASALIVRYHAPQRNIGGDPVDDLPLRNALRLRSVLHIALHWRTPHPTHPCRVDPNVAWSELDSQVLRGDEQGALRRRIARLADEGLDRGHCADHDYGTTALRLHCGRHGAGHLHGAHDVGFVGSQPLRETAGFHRFESAVLKGAVDESINALESFGRGLHKMRTLDG